MVDTKLVRWGGWSLAAAGVTQAAFWLLVIPIGGFVGEGAALNPLWFPSQIIHTLAAIFGLFGVIGLALAHRDSGALGFAGFALTLLGDAFYLADAIIALIIFPILAVNAPALLTADGPINTSPIFIVFAATFMTGFILLCIAMLRSAVLPRGAVILLLIGAVLFNLPPFPAILPAVILGGVVWGAGAVWAGVRLAALPAAQA